MAANKPGVIPEARRLHDLVKEAGYRTFIDDSDKSAGWKFSEYEMKGVPLRLEIGPRDIENKQVTLAKRNTGEKITVKYEELLPTIDRLIKEIHQEMYQKASQYLQDHVTEVRSIEELDEVLNKKGGYAKMMWSGDEESELFIKEKFQATARAIPFNQMPFDDKDPINGKPAKKVVLFAKAY